MGAEIWDEAMPTILFGRVARLMQWLDRIPVRPLALLQVGLARTFTGEVLIAEACEVWDTQPNAGFGSYCVSASRCMRLPTASLSPGTP